MNLIETEPRLDRGVGENDHLVISDDPVVAAHVVDGDVLEAVPWPQLAFQRLVGAVCIEHVRLRHRAVATASTAGPAARGVSRSCSLPAARLGRLRLLY